MRTAKAGDHWRHLYEKPNFKNKFNKLEYENIKGLGTGSIDFQGGITAICGANGVGKTTILNAISSILDSGGIEYDKAIYLKLHGAKLVGEMTSATTMITKTVDISVDDLELSTEKINIESVWIDGSIHAQKMISIFSGMPNLTEMLEAEESRITTNEDLQLLSYIVGKEYDCCSTYELELDHYGIVPYFVVSSEGVQYATETMGLGELTIHFILWHLHRIAKNSIVLMEEPETYLVPRSQEALLDVIAKISVEKRLWVILTTHSPNILKKIPIDHIRLLARIGETVEVLTPTDQSEYLITLGINAQKSGVILVEDRCAREFTKCWLGRYAPNILQEFEVIDINSKENILKQLSSFPFIGKWFKIFGLFDGDQRNEIQSDFLWKYSFLPSNEAPEKLLKRIAKLKRNELAVASGRDIRNITIALNALDGKDHHDWIIEFPRNIGIGYEQLIAFLFEISMSDETLKGCIDEAFNDLGSKLYET